MANLNEGEIEQYTIEELKNLGYQYFNGPDIAPDSDSPERSSYDEVILQGRLLNALVKLNPEIPIEACQQAISEIKRIGSPDTLTNNEAFHRLLTDGVPVTFQKMARKRTIMFG